MDKFREADEPYFKYMDWLDGQTIDLRQALYNFPVFVGAVNLARLLALHAIYAKTVDICGAIADVGTYRGYSFFTFGKLVSLYEPHSTTEVHGFDWFKGMKVGPGDDAAQNGKYVADKAQIAELLERQGLASFCHLHDLDLTQDLPHFFELRRGLRFKLVFLDCGIEDVLEQSLAHMWPRLVPGGVVILDHFNSSASPSESDVVQRYAPNAIVRQFPISRSPTAYLEKPAG